MMRFEQSLQLRRLLVLKSGEALYDERFHEGVNIIRGENSTGKSTIADFIFFALGGEVTEWTPEARSADSVHAEVILGEKTFTLSREVESDTSPPIFIYEGSYEVAVSHRDLWLKYPARRTSNTDSFSQILFRLLHLPEQKTEAQQNITMHQLMRLIYSDQATPVQNIFRIEKKYDTKDIRLAIAELLLGFDDLELHDLRLRIRDCSRSYDEVSGELKTIFNVLGRTIDSDIGLLNFQQELEQLKGERESLLKKVEMLNVNRAAPEKLNGDKVALQVAAKLRDTNQEINHQTQVEQDLQIDIEDSEKFIHSIAERIEALDDSKNMSEFLGQIKFLLCPACLTPISQNGAMSDCHLCKASLGEGGNTGYLKIREELVFQLRESSKLLEDKKEMHASIRKKITKLISERSSLRLSLAGFETRLAPVDAEISSVMHRIGYVDKSIEDMDRKAELAKLLTLKESAKSDLARQIEELKNLLSKLGTKREERRTIVELQIAKLSAQALRKDLHLEEAFDKAELVEFDFGRDRIVVDGRSRFSASSQTYLKNALLFSMFEFSLKDHDLRWPRFILMDNIEDKGMQPDRSANFQNYIVDELSKCDIEHQVIFTTSMISPKLENSKLCVGPHYTKNLKTLQFSGVKENIDALHVRDDRQND